MPSYRHNTFFGVGSQCELDVLKLLAVQLGLPFTVVTTPWGHQVQMRFPDMVLQDYVTDEMYKVRNYLKQTKKLFEQKEPTCEAG